MHTKIRKGVSMNKMSKTILLLAVLLHSESSFLQTDSQHRKKGSTNCAVEETINQAWKKAALCATQMDCARENKQYRTRADVRLVLLLILRWLILYEAASEHNHI